ncbi:M14 family zinc carboxypeptidase [Paludifilum halophilum]|uniref:Peptidase M14 domain-containing protein n=1 Tax=Paludifilum halophilum TaxID=1642702 RepID=A0A235B1R5_9BACL|nr:M14 family zinc carboxypeptidase [Paludifilum halophilum]OYD06248.1 hypothetical protein CHM34_17460 [Paludifilum halophilum]
MRKRCALLFALLLFVSVPAYADPGSVPNGPWLKDAQKMKLKRLHDYEELVKALHRLERVTDGNVQLEVIGQSNENRDIYMAKVGNGPKKMMFVTQQHGDEVMTTEAALNMLNTLGTSNHPAIRNMREEVSLYVVVRANPDGSERYWRYNYDPDAAPEYGSEGKGYDINRYHAPDLTPDQNPVPEAAAIRKAYETYQPHWVIDFHHQGTYKNEDGRMITTSVYWPSHPDVQDPVRRISKQASMVIYDTLSHYGFAEVSQYPGGNYQGIARNAYGLLGSGSVLVEFRGGIGQKSGGKIIRTAYASMFSMVESVSEDTISEYDPDQAEETIPTRGAPVDGGE